MNTSCVNICGFPIDLSGLTRGRRNIFWDDPFFLSHLPVIKEEDCNSDQKEVIKFDTWINKTKAISLPFLMLSKIIPKLVEQQSFLLHTAGLVYNDSLILLFGPSESGKSTVLTELLMRGFKLVGDDKIVFHKKMKVVCGNQIISLREKKIAERFSKRFGVKIEKSKFTNKFYMDPRVDDIVIERSFKKVFIFRMRLNNIKTRFDSWNQNSVTYDLFKDVLGTIRGFEAFSVDPPFISDLALVRGLDYRFTKILKNIRTVVYRNKNNLFSVEGRSSAVTNKIIDVVQV